MRTVIILVGALLVSLIVHEAAHALAMRRLGVRINRAGIGAPIWPTLTIRTRWGFDFTLSPWLVGAYVSASETDSDHLARLPYRQQAWYLNAGIVANGLLGFVALTAHTAIAGRWTAAVVLAASGAATWFARMFIAAYILPAAAALALPLVAYGLIASWSQGETGVGYAGLADAVPAQTPALLTLAVVSFALGIINTLPLYGLDNGKVVGLLLERWASGWVLRAYQIGGVSLVVLMLVASVGSDLWAIVAAAL